MRKIMNILMSTLNAKYIHTNLAMRLIKAYARPEFEIDLIEYTIKDPTLQIVGDLYQLQPDVMLFSCYIWNVEQTFEVMTLLKKLLPNVIIIIGGPEVSYDLEEWLRQSSAIDFIVVGEGEATTKHLLAEINGKKQYETVAGIAFRQGAEIVITPKRPKLDLNTIPSPYRFATDLPHLSKRITYIETSRGCPFNCQFCLSSTEAGVRYFDLQRMKDELRFLMKNGARVIKFLDRTFNTNPQYAKEMLQFLIDEHTPNTVFQFEITADIMPLALIEFLNEKAPVGLFRFEIGVQSTHEETNLIIGRKQNFEKLTRVVKLIKKGGKITQHLDLIAGLPKEDYATFSKTFNDVFALRPEELQLGFLKMLRGTGLRQRGAEADYIYLDKPPYEILQNNVLTFADVRRLKQVEDILEKYWNAHRMDPTIEYLIGHAFETPFDFFQEFGTYWEACGWQRVGHQLEDLFKRLYQFLQAKQVKDIDIILALMKLDYFQLQKFKPRKIWWDHLLEKDVYSPYYQRLLAQPEILGTEFKRLNLSQKALYKHTAFEFLPFDYNAFKEKGVIERGNWMILSYYSGKGELCTIFAAPVAAFESSL